MKLVIGLVILLASTIGMVFAISKYQPKTNGAYSNLEEMPNTLADHTFLMTLRSDPFYPKPDVDILSEALESLVRLLIDVRPEKLEELYVLTNGTVLIINQLQEDGLLEDQGGIDTVAREALSDEFVTIALAFGFQADRESLINARDW